MIQNNFIKIFKQLFVTFNYSQNFVRFVSRYWIYKNNFSYNLKFSSWFFYFILLLFFLIEFIIDLIK